MRGLSGRASRSRRELRSGGLHSFHDVLVTGTAADVACDAETDLLLARIWIFLEQAIRTSEHAGGAIAALQSVLFVECLLECMQHSALFESLDGEHLGTIAGHAEHRARLDRHSVDIDGAHTTVR